MGTYGVEQGRPVIRHGGEIVNQAAYLDRIMRGDWEERVREFVDSGVKTHYINVPHGGADFFDAAFWTDDGVYPLDETGAPLPMAKQAEIILRLCPEAKLFTVCMSSVPIGWAKKHPEHMQTDEDGRTYREATMASPLYLEGIARCLRTQVQYCCMQPWGERVVGHLVYPYGEGAMPLNHSGRMFDVSGVNEAQFRLWLERKYGSEQALREAWDDPAVTFATARIPRDREWLAKRASAVPTIGGQPSKLRSLPSNSGETSKGLFHWVEATALRREHDYLFFMQENFRRWVRTMNTALKEEIAAQGVERLVGFDITKLPLLGWQIQSAFDGIGDGQSFPNNNYLSGSFGVGELLDELDCIVTPADYHARTLGFAYEAEGVSDSLVLRGKPMIVENDARNYVGAGIYDQGAFRDDTEAAVGLARNAALTMTRGIQSYWCNVGSSYFHAPGIHQTIARLTPMLDATDRWPHRETRDAIAMVIDDESPLYEDFTSGYQSLAVIWQRIRGLAHCGIPYRIYLLSDLAKDNFPDYKAYLFPNLFKVDDATLDLLRRKVLRNGNLAIFGPSTGITDGRHLTPEPATRLLGVPMELHERSCVRHVIVQDIPGHPITRELPAGQVFGDSLPYGPTLTPEDGAVEARGATTLGHANLCWFIHRTGFFIRETSDAKIVWSCAMPLPANVLRACARYAGCHVWGEEEDVIYASDSVAAIHTVKRGPRTLKLPRRCEVTDALNGESMGTTDALHLELKAPDTRIFRLG